MSCDMTADRDYTSPTPTDMFDHYLPKAVKCFLLIKII